MTKFNYYFQNPRKIFVIAFILLGTIVFGQVGIQTNSPDASSALDIVASDKGLLIPRVTLSSSLGSASPVTSPATGLLVFNTGANQAVGLYYWDGSAWNLFNSGAVSSDYWNLTGNTGTTVGTNFIGTTDAEDFATYTNNTERMRFTSGGQGLVGLTTPYAAEDFFSVDGTATQTWAINGYGDVCGVYGSGGGYGLYGSGGTFGLRTTVDGSSSYSSYSTNADADGWAAMFAGSGFNGSYLTGHSAGTSAVGNDGVFAAGKASDGIGIIAGGNNVSTFSTIPTGAGGAFTGYHGAYGSAVNASLGVGIIGVGNDHGTYNTTSNGSGGSFTGYHGLISTAYNSIGTGVIGVGNGGSYYLFTYGGGLGSGGAFTGDRCGVAGWATVNNTSSVGVFGYYDGVGSTRDGCGVIGIGAANAGSGRGVYGQGGQWGVYANGNLGASGTKSFAIDHPMDPENKILKHYSIESDEVLNMYRGVINLDENGEAQITLADYFLVININFSYTLTSIGISSPNLFIKDEIDENSQFTIGGGHPNQKVSWVVYAERNDPYMQKYRYREVDVVEKEDHEKGKYIMPELYGQPEEMGMYYIDMGQKAESTIKQQTIKNKAQKISEKELITSGKNNDKSH